MKLPDVPEDENVEWPLGVVNLCVLACFFLLREVEVSLLLFKSVTMDMAAETVSLHFPATKADPKALGCARSWGCICGVLGAPLLCPFHAALRQQALLRAYFAEDFLDNQSPFFPTWLGVAVVKEVVVEIIEFVCGLLGLPLVAKSGRRAYGGHAFRVGGARHLARAGSSIAVITLLGRWGSDVVLGYLRDAPHRGPHSLLQGPRSCFIITGFIIPGG